ncbi:MAG: YIP1 family protein, partial [Planctomycetes bacterium]|nr:YIP1 family protein [Planctomycetota bacterium]
SYYGTGEKGHLVPVQFACVSCEQHIHMDEMVVLPTEGVEEEQTKVDTMPWLERKGKGVLRAWFSTVGKALVSPGRLIHSVPNDSSVGSAVWFAVFSNALIYLVGLITLMILPLILSFSMARMPSPGGGPPGGLPIAAMMMASLGGMAVTMYLGTIALMLLTGLVAHGLLRLTGKTESTMGRTFHAVCYSSGANVGSAVPCLGLYFGWIWWLVSAVLMVREGQRVHGGRAVFAVLTTPALGLSAIIAWIVISAFSATTNFAMSGTAATQTVLTGLLAYAGEQNKLGPDHAIQLVSGGFVTGFDLVATGSNTLEEDVPVADTNLNKFTKLPSENQAKAVQAAIDALPPGTIAHRLGDFVFTYHGIDLSNADPGLWLVIMSPDPDVNPAGSSGTVITFSGPGMTATSTTSSGGMVVAGLVDGTSLLAPLGGFAQTLQMQNMLRAKYNLPPLPDPATVTHAKPAVAISQPQTGETIPDPSEPDDASVPEDEHP